jgi:hypothetical protein
MPTKHRAEIAKMKMTGWHYFPFDVVDWLTSADVLRMTLADRGAYITFLAVQWRDGYVDADDRLAAKQSGVDSRSVTRWMQRWSHLFPISVLSRNHRVNVKLNEIAIEKGNPKAQGGTEERRVEEIREEDEEVGSKSVSQGAPTTSGFSSEDQNLEVLFSEEQPQTQLLFEILYPNGFESVALFNREVPHARACAEKLAKEKVSVRELLKYNRTHKSAGLVFRSCAQLLKALSTDEQRVLQDFVGHDASSCRTCKAIAKKGAAV